MSDIYTESDDSYLMYHFLLKKIPELVRKKPSLVVLEVGSGSGIQLKALLKSGIKKQNIFSCDINKKAVEHCKNLGFNFIKSDLFENIQDKFDLIIFNAPYLPEDKKEPEISKISTTGGKKGSEIINKFLKQATNYLTDNGKIFLLTSSLTKKINWLNYKKKIVTEKSLFFEKLFIWEVTKS